MTTVGYLRRLLERYPDDTAVVLKNGHNAYGDITPESIDQVLLRPHTAARIEATFGERAAPGTFDAVRIDHAAS